MQTRASLLLAASLATLLFATGRALAADTPSGQELAFDNRKGNCLACHAIPGDPKAITEANIGPPLVAMKARYPDREKLRAQIWDATRANPNTAMPPFGKHKILSAEELDKIVDYVHSL